MTYQDICKKLGFDPLVDKYDYQLSDHEDDRFPSPYSVLTDEESDILLEYVLSHKRGKRGQNNKGDVPDV